MLVGASYCIITGSFVPHFTRYIQSPLVYWADASPCIATRLGTASPVFYFFAATTLPRFASEIYLARAARYALNQGSLRLVRFTLTPALGRRTSSLILGFRALHS